ncbi:uncharacterized protein PITG_13468 [Phytophthora infestans T30-4]|uniref:Uncharacterized protein n=1 Tax=Phytophthora infestans (strain T30-4) TaxID=403677 RepID=D0NM29_PHYIT|nr:uncharacterized protein PITG_13468 [Phytophthora infestans T30-4]EEY60750.1 hypothetical protein PITG_13468 [Phytophthora infestans T30-4]|eukprot:XP_002899696.1 hypothetical protein PITG_13468 [Phytophthora infestans T30-4]
MLLRGRKARLPESYSDSTLNGVASLFCRVGLHLRNCDPLTTRLVTDFMSVLHYEMYKNNFPISSYASDPVLAFGASRVCSDLPSTSYGHSDDGRSSEDEPMDQNEEEDASTMLAFRSLDPSEVFKANHPLHAVPPHEIIQLSISPRERITPDRQERVIRTTHLTGCFKTEVTQGASLDCSPSVGRFLEEVEVAAP